MDFRPDGIYTGFLAGDVQAEMALEFIERFADSNTRILTDPITRRQWDGIPHLYRSPL